MLVIRSEQFRVFESKAFQHFEDDMVAHLSRRFADWPLVAGQKDLRTFVRTAMKNAKTFAIANKYDLRRFLEFSAEYGIEFFKLPWAAKILGDSTLSACGKLEQLDDYSLFVLRTPAQHG